MSVLLRRSLLLCLLAIGIGALSLEGADPPLKPPAKNGIDFSKLPPGTIFIVGDDVKDALQQPGVVILTPEKFKEMLAQIDQLKRQANPDKPEFRGECRLTGKVEGDIVHFQAHFEFKTRQPNELVPLGCQKAKPTAATLDDGKLPLLPTPGEDGFVVQVETPGTHRLTLDLDLAVTPRGPKGTERGFELALPRAAITMLEALDVPDYVRDLRIAGLQLPVPAKELSARNGQRIKVALGPVDRLDVSWKGPAPQKQAVPVLTSTGQIDVRVDDTHVSTEAELSLQAVNGQAAQWQLQVPPMPQTTVEVDGAPNDDRTPMVIPPTDAKSPLWTIKLKEPSGEPVKLRIRTHQPRVAGKPAGIGPFVVLGALQQSGTITVNIPADLRLRPRLRGDIMQQKITDDSKRGNNTTATFTYWNLPQPANNGQLVPPALELEVDSVKGTLETTLDHKLRLTPQGWLLKTEIKVVPSRMEVERLEFELPADYEAKVSPGRLAEPDLEIKEMGSKRIGVIKLARQLSSEFKITLDAMLPLPDDAKTPMVVPVALPRPIGTLDHGGEITVSVPDNKELTVARESGAQMLTPPRREYSWHVDRAPARLEMGWRDYRPELPVDMLVDVTLADRQVFVRQKLMFRFPADSLREVVLRATDFPEGRMPSAERVTLTPKEAGTWTATLKDPTLLLEYSFKPESGSFTVPLVWPDATHCQTKVRVWSDAGTQPVLESPQWENRPLEIVADRDTLPALVLRSDGLRVPLRLAARSVASLPTISVDRALVQVTIGDGGQQRYRARFLLVQMHARSLDIELPAPPSSLPLELLLDGKVVSNYVAVDEEGKETDNGRIVRLKVEPELYRRPVVLELRYPVAPGRTEGNARLQTTFYPPRLRGNLFAGRVRWQIAMPADWVPIWTGSQTTVDQRWGWKSWMPAPRPAATALDLERWFTANTDFRALTPEAEAELATRGSELVCWQTTLAPLVLIHAPQQGWWLACSLVLLAIGLALYFVSSSPRAFAAAVVALGVVLLIAGLWWQSALPAVIFGCEPGAVVLLVVVTLMWWMQHRYRRQLVFMPGFSRMAPGSSVVRTGSSQRLGRDPSTVDAPLGVVPQDLGSRQEAIPRK